MAKFWRKIREVIDSVAAVNGIPLNKLRGLASSKDKGKIAGTLVDLVWPMVELRLQTFIDDLQEDLNERIDELQAELTKENLKEVIEAALSTKK